MASAYWAVIRKKLIFRAKNWPRLIRRKYGIFWIWGRSKARRGKSGLNLTSFLVNGAEIVSQSKGCVISH